ncbi:MAG TPA: DUF2794 domain-containing protein [Hyphomonadaceae bacterium]|nr:DUF2794 domain-containing protein [Hyphomonadaceae bacterium]HPN06757.1 DUF2794 domain-containing protein [Hyphomonadaceae bacterium]
MTDQPQAGIHSSPQGPVSAQKRVWFDRKELELILRVYGRMVAEGECRDYAIGAHSDHALFHMFRRASEAPTYVVEKRPELARRQGAYSVSNSTGQILKRGQELEQVLRVFDKKRFNVVG